MDRNIYGGALAHPKRHELMTKEREGEMKIQLHFAITNPGVKKICLDIGMIQDTPGHGNTLT